MKKFLLAVVLSIGLAFGMCVPVEAQYLYAYTNEKGSDIYVVSESIQCDLEKEPVPLSLNIFVVNPKYQGFESYEFAWSNGEWYWSLGAGTIPSHRVENNSGEMNIVCVALAYLDGQYDEEE